MLINSLTLLAVFYQNKFTVSEKDVCLQFQSLFSIIMGSEAKFLMPLINHKLTHFRKPHHEKKSAFSCLTCWGFSRVR